MFWKRKSESPSPSRADAARAVSFDQPRPTPILKPAPIHVDTQSANQSAVGGNIRFAGSVAPSCASPTRPTFNTIGQASPRPRAATSDQVQARPQSEHVGGSRQHPYPQQMQQQQQESLQLARASPLAQAQVQVQASMQHPSIQPTRHVQPMTSPRQMPSAPAMRTQMRVDTAMAQRQRDASSSHSHIHAPQPVVATRSVSPSSANPAIQRVQGNRRSSRPTSPSTTSFGRRLPFDVSGQSASGAIAGAGAGKSSGNTMSPLVRAASPLTTPPLGCSSHVTTPPTAYASSMHSRAPPPPSPYRPTSERRDLEPLSRTVRATSLFDSPTSTSCPRLSPNMHSNALLGTPKASGSVPTLNIIPATPQQLADEWHVRRAASDLRMQLEGAFGEMVDIPLDPTGSTSVANDIQSELKHAPQVEARVLLERARKQESLPELGELSFSPFESHVSLPSLPSTSSVSSIAYTLSSPPKSTRTPTPPSATAPLPSTTRLPSPPTEPLPSPPFESFASLPSLDSEGSMPSSASCSSIRSSSSCSSLNSYSDVEEALGSMLASLSDPAMPLSSMSSGSFTDRQRSKRPTMPDTDMTTSNGNPGLGLGLGLALSSSSSISVTAPLSPRRKAPPPPLDLRTASGAAAPTLQSAPPRINHRVAFYSSARAAPNSSSSGVFIKIPHSTSSGSVQSQSPTTHVKPLSSGLGSGTTEFIVSTPVSRTWSDSTLSTDETELGYVRERARTRTRSESVSASFRDSISIASEASDEDLQTASIVCLTPVIKRLGEASASATAAAASMYETYEYPTVARRSSCRDASGFERGSEFRGRDRVEYEHDYDYEDEVGAEAEAGVMPMYVAEVGVAL